MTPKKLRLDAISRTTFIRMKANKYNKLELRPCNVGSHSAWQRPQGRRKWHQVVETAAELFEGHLNHLIMMMMMMMTKCLEGYIENSRN